VQASITAMGIDATRPFSNIRLAWTGRTIHYHQFITNVAKSITFMFATIVYDFPKLPISNLLHARIAWTGRTINCFSGCARVMIPMIATEGG
jgi:hypothetical protein